MNKEQKEFLVKIMDYYLARLSLLRNYLKKYPDTLMTCELKNKPNDKLLFLNLIATYSDKILFEKDLNNISFDNVINQIHTLQDTLSSMKEEKDNDQITIKSALNKYKKGEGINND